MSKFSTHDLIQQLHDKRLAIRAQQSELVQRMEAMGDREFAVASPSLREQWEARDAEFASLGERVDQLLTTEEHGRELEDARKPFNHSIRGRTNMEQTELSNWLRHGGASNTDNATTFDVNLNDLERHDLTTGGSAGAAVPAGFVGAFYQHMIASAGVRRTNATVYTTAGGEPLKIPKSTVDPTAAIVAEGVAITPNDPTFASVTLTPNAYKALVYVSRELVQDSDVDIEGILGRLLGRAIGQANGTDMVTGNGTSKPQGVNASPVAGVTTTWAALIAGATGPDLLNNLYFSVNPPYREQAYWLMADATLATLRTMKDTTNAYLIQRDLTQGPVLSLFGRPVVTDPNVSTGAGAKDVVLFGDFSSYYAIRDVGGVRLERSEDFRFANDEVAFRAVLRTDGRQVLNDTTNSAVKVIHDTA